MNFNPVSYIRSDILGLQPYTPILPFEILSQQLGRQPSEIIKLDANENPFGPSPLVKKRLALAPYLHIYPDPESQFLRTALADYTGLESDYLMVGHGADELIDLILRLFIQPGEAIVNCPPTFGMYRFDAEVNQAKVFNVWRGQDFSLEIDKIEALFNQVATPGTTITSAPKLIFVTSPNNPDGSVIGDNDLKRLLALPAVIVLDEAYVEFSGGGRIQWVKQYNNLIVLRTFSKWAGLAGLRVGYGAFPLDVIEHLWKIKQPYNINVAGQIAALASLEDRGWLMENVAKLIHCRETFYHQLMDASSWLKPYPSQTNFILCRVEGRSALEVKQALASQGILVRYYNTAGLTDHIRFSIGTSGQMAQVMEVIQQL